MVQLDDVWGCGGKSLRERLLEARTPALKFCVLEGLLLQHCTPEFDPAIQYAVSALEGGMPLAQLHNREAGLLAQNPCAPVFPSGWDPSQAVCPSAAPPAGLASGAPFLKP